MGFYAWKPYVPVAQRRKKAAAQAQKLAKKGEVLAPVAIEGRTIAKSFWGKSWCENLERYSDYENRLPRGRTYVRNGSVIDLKVAHGEVTALVSGSDIYRIKITVEPVSPKMWKALCTDCAGSIDSLVELLQGRFSKAVMERVCMPEKGLFPSPKEIKLSCSCPDWASMCKHVAAVLYGVGARLDNQPEMLFTLRGVDQHELVAQAGRHDLPFGRKPASSKRILAGGDLAALFGLDMAGSSEEIADDPAAKTPAKRKQQTKTKSNIPQPKAKDKASTPVAKTAAKGKKEMKPSGVKTGSKKPTASTGKRSNSKSGIATKAKFTTKNTVKLKASSKATKASERATLSRSSNKKPTPAAAKKTAEGFTHAD
jgi:uncharacterized Zn finger protein